MPNLKPALDKQLTATEYNALDRYTKAVWGEVYRERMAVYRKVTPYTYSYCSDLASMDASRAARAYAATGERIEFEATR